MQEKLVLIDADTLIFSAAAVTERRSISVTHKPTGIIKRFNTRTEFKELMKLKNKVITEDYIIQDNQEAEPIQNTLKSLYSGMDKILSKYDFEEVKIVSGDDNNFRMNLPLPIRYKSNRDTMLRPINLKEAHKKFQKKYGALRANGYEADDLVTILANKGINEGREVILLSPDKDTRQTIGTYVGDYDSENLVLVQDMHEVYLDKYKKVKSYGIPWIASQILLGDPTDAYNPRDLVDSRYGDMSCYKDLVECSTPKECLELVVNKYQEWFGDNFTYKTWDNKEVTTDWKGILQLYYSCAKMKTSEDDQLVVGDFFGKYGVTL